MAKRFLCKALKTMKSEGGPDVINTDKNPAYGAALNEMKAQGKCEADVQHRAENYRKAEHFAVRDFGAR
jgi:transposase-like protein